MAVALRQNLVSRGKYNIKCPYSMKAESITVHNTANDASAANEVKYMIGNNKKVSFHIAVDDKEAVQGIPLDRNAWHAGDGNGKGNRSSIGVEICHSKSGGERFAKAERNAAELIASMLKERGWGIDRVKKHQDWSGKYCPHRTLDLGWQRFLNMVHEYLGTKPSKPVAPQKPSKPSGNKLEVDGSHGPRTTRRKQQIYGTKQDAIISGQPTCNKKYCYALNKGGCVRWVTGNASGSDVFRAEQGDLFARGYYQGVIDGYMGKKHVIAKQKFLRDKGFYKGEIDGSYGVETCKADQRWMNSL